MITLYNFGPNFNLPDPSPFCLKVETYLRAAGLDFNIVSSIDNLGKAPKRKLPFITDGERVVCDSEFIVDYLKDTYGDVLDQDLNQEQRAIGRAFIKMMDENLYWCMIYSRWIDPKVWPLASKAFFGNLPFPLNRFAPFMAQRQVKKGLYTQGMGRHSHAEILAVARKDLAALSSLLGNKDYFLINKVTTMDVCVYAFLAQFIIPDYESDFNIMAESYSNLVSFVVRMKKKYYPDQ